MVAPRRGPSCVPGVAQKEVSFKSQITASYFAAFRLFVVCLAAFRLVLVCLFGGPYTHFEGVLSGIKKQ